MSALPLYRPANGTEGEWFEAGFCDWCVHNAGLRAGTDDVGCDIQMRAMLFDTDCEHYPREWVRHPEEGPICTAFRVEIGS